MIEEREIILMSLRKTGPKPIDPEARFWKHVQKKKNGCWVWTGATRGGYGRFGVHAGESVDAHRFSWRLSYGEIPMGNGVFHRCDNRPCVRPSHLFSGTQFDNMQDASQKGRLCGPGQKLSGSKNPSAKMSDYQVLEIRERLKSRETHASLAARYGVSVSAIERISARESWRNL